MADKTKPAAPSGDELARLGRNFRVLQIIPPYKNGDIVPAWAFGLDYPASLINHKAIEHCHDPVTVDVPEPISATKPELPATAADDEVRAENRSLRRSVDDLSAKLASAETGHKEALAAIAEAKTAATDAGEEMEKLRKANESLLAENNRLRLEGGHGPVTANTEAKGENPVATPEPAAAMPANPKPATGPGGGKPKAK